MRQGGTMTRTTGFCGSLAIRGSTVAVAAAFAIAASGPAVAQDIIPPKAYSVTPGGVNVADRSLVYSVTDLSLGPLQLERFHRPGQQQPNDPPFGSNFSYNFHHHFAVNVDWQRHASGK